MGVPSVTVVPDRRLDRHRVEEVLGDPDLYRDPETAASVVAEHEAAKDRAAEAMATWEDLDRKMRS